MQKQWSRLDIYPALGAIPGGDHETDRTQGSRSRDKQVGNKQLESNSVKKYCFLNLLIKC